MSTPTSRRARLSEYAPWILRDYLTNQGPSTILVVALIGFMMLLPVMQTAGSAWRMGQVPHSIAVRLLRELAVPLAFLGTFFATNGIISNDRKFSFFKFLFAKPVRPPQYYALAFLVYGFGMMIVTLVMLGAWALAVRPMFPPELFAVVALMYLAYGGIGFALSAAWRFDWLSLVTVLLVANFAWSMWEKSDAPAHWLLYLLPPVHRANDAYALISHDTLAAIQWGSIAWLGGYGLACFLLGLLVIRRRPLGAS
jgi:hypothetical protein